MRPNVPAAVIEYVKALPEDNGIEIEMLLNDVEEVKNRWVINSSGLTAPQWSVTIRGVGSAVRSVLGGGTHESLRTAFSIAMIGAFEEHDRILLLLNTSERSKKRRDTKREFYTNGITALESLKSVVDAEWPEDAK